VTPENARLARLRGALQPVSVGARGLEAVARNPACLRLRAIVVSGLTAGEVAEKVFGQLPDAMSPFALTANLGFKRQLLAHAAGALLAAYREKTRLAPSEAKITSVTDHAPGKGALDEQRRHQETRRLVDLKRQGNPAAPNLIIGPRLTVEIVGVTHAVEVDYLVASDADDMYRVGVIKSYADRGGKTDPADLRAACREGAVGTLALAQMLKAMGDDPDRAGERIDLVLKAPGSAFPRLFADQRAQSELSSLARALATAPVDLADVEALLPPGGALDDPAALNAIPNNFGSGCKEHCALHERCRGHAQANGAPIVLGEQAAEQLAPAGSIDRALDLMNGRGRPPDTPAEEALRRSLRQAAQTLERIANV
jgi:hypothetical protein